MVKMIVFTAILIISALLVTCFCAGIDDGNELGKLIEAMKYEDRTEFPQNEEKISEFGEIAIEPLVAIIDSDEDSLFKQRAAYTLGLIGEDALPDLLDRLTSENPETRFYTCKALSFMGESAADAVPNLINTLSDESLKVRNEAVRALGNIGPAAEPSVPHIIALLEGCSDSILFEIILALADIGPEAKEAIFPLLDFAKENPEVASSYFIYLATVFVNIGEPAVMPLVSAMQSEEPAVREIALNALGGLQEVAGIATIQLAEILQDERASVRWGTAQILWMIGPEAQEALPALRELLKDENADVREMAQQAIEAISTDGTE